MRCRNITIIPGAPSCPRYVFAPFPPFVCFLLRLLHARAWEEIHYFTPEVMHPVMEPRIALLWWCGKATLAPKRLLVSGGTVTPISDVLSKHKNFEVYTWYIYLNAVGYEFRLARVYRNTYVARKPPTTAAWVFSRKRSCSDSKEMPTPQIRGAAVVENGWNVGFTKSDKK